MEGFGKGFFPRMWKVCEQGVAKDGDAESARKKAREREKLKRKYKFLNEKREEIFYGEEKKRVERGKGL